MEQTGLHQRALLQGLMTGLILREKDTGDFPLLLDKEEPVAIPVDEDGYYEHHFIVKTFSGVRLRVTVEVEE